MRIRLILGCSLLFATFPAIAVNHWRRGPTAQRFSTRKSHRPSADEIDLIKGEVISEINRKPVTDEASYRAVVSGLRSKDDVVFVIHNPQQKGSSYIGGTLE